MALSRANPHAGRKQVLGGRDQHALLHQAGGVADASHVAARSLDFEAIQIGAAEHDSRSGRSRKHAHLNRSAAMQAHSAAFHGRAKCLLLIQGMSLYVPVYE